MDIDKNLLNDLMEKMENGTMSVADIPKYLDLIKQVANSSEDIQEEIEDWDCVIQFNVIDELKAYVIVKDGKLDIGVGEHDNPTITLMMSGPTAIGLFSGEIDGTSAYMAGEITIDGPLPEAIKFNNISGMIREELEEFEED
ncbi:MAG: SCP2 sterol-binding domain-containing protein [Promethearchaeota archaeon]